MVCIVYESGTDASKGCSRKLKEEQEEDVRANERKDDETEENGKRESSSAEKQKSERQND